MRRMALRLGLPASHSARVVADAAADRLAAPRDTLRTLFDGPLPTNEGDLVAEARALHQLEAALENTAPGLVHGGHSAASGAATSSPAQGAPTRPTPEDPTERSTP